MGGALPEVASCARLPLAVPMTAPRPSEPSEPDAVPHPSQTDTEHSRTRQQQHTSSTSILFSI